MQGDVPRKKGGDSEACLGYRDDPFLCFVSIFRKSLSAHLF